MHLFCGSGGGLLADVILGHEPICAIDSSRYCCDVLSQRVSEGWFPGLEVKCEDIRGFDPKPYKGRVDCVHAGFPCQDISCAGKGLGIVKGVRSGLWVEVVRVVRALGPRWVFLENSPRITGRGLDTVLRDLASMGYDARWMVLSAADVGAPHVRARWWCLATNSNFNERKTWSEQSGRGFKQGSSNTSMCCDDMEDVGNSVGVGLEESQSSNEKQQSSASRASEWWSVEPSVGRVAYGVANRVDRIKAIGNGQVPFCAAVAWKMLGGE